LGTPSILIHVVSEGNAGLLDRVEDDVFDDAISPHLLRAFLANPANHLVVAVADDRVVGMASGIAYVHPDKPLALFINEVGVCARFRRQGLGQRLVSALIERGRGLGCTEAWVATEASNTPARALYESLGGVADEEHAVVYIYPLSGPAGAAASAGDI
jgi:ribosomal protein S18 acetylase RimI-like enzyme